MKGYNFQKMIKQAQQMQKQMENTQEELSSIEVSGIAGGGAISVVFNGKNEFKSIKIKPEAINPENPESVDSETVEMLEDLISSAIKDANLKASLLVQEKMSSITGGMNLNIPGLF
ncbi:MAG: YbaB/EbfC family nucleoid-associated protein [bacterium]